MAASTTLITNVQSVISAGPTAATLAKATNPTGPIMGYADNCNAALLKLKEAKVLLNQIITDTDAADPSLVSLQNVVQSLV